MGRLRVVLLACATLAALPAAGATSRQNDVCFLRHDIEGFSAPNDRTVYLNIRFHDVYRLDLMTDCIGLSFKQGFELEDQPASPWICDPLDATVIVREGGIRQRCPVTTIHKLTADELKALPKRDRP
jgi:hypothetical protein